jgi:hypothetical protein
MRSVAPLLFVGLLAASGCTVCHEQIVGESSSPDLTWTTRTTVRDCGNLSTPTTIVYLQRADSRTRLGEIVVLVRHEHPLTTTWTGRTQLRVECPGCKDDVRIARPSAHGIAITVVR